MKSPDFPFNVRFAKTYDPNHEPWLTWKEVAAYVAALGETKKFKMEVKRTKKG